MFNLKTMKTRIFTLIVSLFITAMAFAYDVQIDGIYYNLDNENKTAEVTSQYSWSGNNYSGITNITIPSIISYDGTAYSVTSIGEYAFYSCSSLISLKIGRNVSLIDVAAFYKCGSLASVYCAPTIPPAIHYGRYVAYDESNAYRQGGGTFPFNSEMKIYVPRGSYNSYMQYSDYTGDYSSAQTNWYKYESYIEPYDFE